MERKTINAREAAEFLGISYYLVLDLCKKSELPHVRMGKRVLFRIDTLQEWLEEQERNSIKQEKEGALFEY